MIAPLDVTAFREALSSLEIALAEPTEDVNPIKQQMMRDSVIQRFEYTYELAWKTMRRALEIQHETPLDDVGRRDLFRRAFETGLIENPSPWFGYQDARNKTAHAYDQKIAADVFQSVRPFLEDAKKLLIALKRNYGGS